MNRTVFHEIYKDVLLLWPKIIDITDKHIFTNGGMNAKQLIAAHDAIENSIEEKVQNKKQEIIDWYRLIDWSIYQKLHSITKMSDSNVIQPHALVNEEDILQLCLENEEFLPDWEG